MDEGVWEELFMKHLGDITKISGFEAPQVDIICGGSPCQDLSVAGKRKGLQHSALGNEETTRSGLFMEQIRIIKEMRERGRRDGLSDDDIRPRYMVWENVTGAFSSNKGEDFRAVLEETAKVVDKNAIIPEPQNGKWTPSGCILGDGWSIAWRVHDAQFWGVPQRRKRIALVADFGGESAPQILFESESLSGNTQSSGEKGKGTSQDVERSFGEAISFQERGGKPGGGKGILIQNEKIGTLSTLNNQSVLKNIHCIDMGAGKSGCNITENKTSTLTCTHGGEPVINALEFERKAKTIFGDEIVGTLVSSMITPTGTVQDKNVIIEEASGKTICIGNGQADNAARPDVEVCKTLNCMDDLMKILCVNNTNDVSEMKSICIGNGQLHDALCPSEEVSKTLNCMDDPMKVIAMESFHCTSEEEKVQTLKARDYKDPQVVTYGLDRASFNQGKNAKYDFSIEEEKIGAQVARGPGAICQSVIRRLTPLECERLQGYPDHWTDIGDWIDSKGKKHKGDSDSPRYKALGNSIALPFWQWMAERMCSYLEEPTMASLFDGIGGFPLVYQRCGCKPIWASEIEEFPIAVTKIRFPE